MTKSLIWLISLFSTTLTFGQQFSAEKIRIEIIQGDTDTITDVSFRDKNDGQIRDGNGNILTDPKLIFFSGAKNILVIKNQTKSLLGLRLVMKVGDALKPMNQSLINLAAEGPEIQFFFDENGIIAPDDKLLHQDGSKITDVEVQIINPTTAQELSSVSLANINIAATSGNGSLSSSTSNVSPVLKPSLEKLVKQNSLATNCFSCNESSSEGLIIYDFKCKQFFHYVCGKKEGINLNKYRLKENDQIQLKIENVNRYLYDVSVSGSDIYYESEMPRLLRQLFIGDSTVLGGLLNVFSGAASQSLKDDDKAKTDLDLKYGEFIKKYRSFIRLYDNIQAMRLKVYYLCADFSCCDPKEFELQYTDLMEALLDVRIVLSDLQIAMNKDGKIQKIRESINESRTKLDQCAKAESNLVAVRRDIKVLTEKEKLTEKETATLKELTTKEKDLATSQCDEDKISTIKAAILEKKNELEPYLGLERLQRSIPEKEELARLFLFVKNISNQNSFFLTPPIFVQGNRFELAIKIAPNDSSLAKKWELMPLYNDSLYIDIPIVKKAFVSFSSGSFMSIDTRLNDRTFDWQAVPNGSNVIDPSSGFVLTESGYSAPVMGFAALANLEFKLSPNLGVGASTGVGLTIEKRPRMAYLAGITVFAGDLRQLSLTLGLAAMQIQRLKNNLQAVVDEKIIYTAKADIEYYERLAVGSFVSISFTPFNVNRRPVFKSGKSNKK